MTHLQPASKAITDLVKILRTTCDLLTEADHFEDKEERTQAFISILVDDLEMLTEQGARELASLA